MRNESKERSSHPKISALESRCQLWLERHTNGIAALLLAGGFVARIQSASGTFLNPDEAQHFLVANRASLALAYKSSLTLAHPPLLIFVLYFWRIFGNSELVLRMSSVLAGILFCWLFFKWLDVILGHTEALLGLVFVALLPPLVSLSSQVRQYSLLLLFMTLAAYTFERSLAKNSALLMALFSISLYLAMLSHYSALFFTASIGVYAVLRFTTQRFPMKVIFTWIAGQACALGLFIFLYRTHISKLKGSSVAQEAAEGWLRRSYFHRGQDHLFLFILGRTFGIFQYIFGNLAIGDVMGLLFVGGLVLLVRHENENIQRDRIAPALWQLLIFLLLPLALNCAAALAGAYPFGGTRHSVFLVIFCVAGISFFLASIFKQKTVRSFATALVIVAACALFVMPHQPYMTRSDQSRSQMERSLSFIQERIPQTTPIFIDVQTRMLLGYYLCRDQQTSAEAPAQNFEVLQCGGYQLITANVWLLDADTFQDWWNKMIRTYDLKSGDNIWVVQEGWGADVASKLKSEKIDFKNLKINSFGRNIQIFQLTVGQSALKAQLSSVAGAT